MHRRKQKELLDYFNQDSPNNVVTAEAMAFILELIDLAITNNSSFTFDNTFDPDNDLNFSSVQEFENYLTDIENRSVTNFEIADDTQNEEKIASVEFPNGLFNSLKINVKQKLSPYSVLNITSYLTGITLFDSWEQKEYTVDNNYFDSVRIDLYGTMSLKIFTEGIGTIYIYDKHYVILISKNSGQIYAAYTLP